MPGLRATVTGSVVHRCRHGLPEATPHVLALRGEFASRLGGVVDHAGDRVTLTRGNYVRAVHSATAVPHDLVPLASAFGSFSAAITLCRWGGTVLLMRRSTGRRTCSVCPRCCGGWRRWRPLWTLVGVSGGVERRRAEAGDGGGAVGVTAAR